jgi:hypothetical protein
MLFFSYLQFLMGLETIRRFDSDPRLIFLSEPLW